MDHVAEDTAPAQAARSPRIRAVMLVVTALLFCAVVAWRLLAIGPFGWHVGTPQTWQGGLEALVLVAGLAGLQFVASSRLRIALSAALAALYLRRHAVDIPLLVDALYLEITVALGALALRAGGDGKPRDGEDYLRAFALGLAVWSVCAWTASALGAGTTKDLRWLTLLLAVALPLARAQPLVAYAARAFGTLSRGDRAVAAALAGWFCVLFARTNVVTGFDPLWYGLRGEYVLTGEVSAYRSLGLVSPVHYFPKMYELYLQPLSGLGDFSAINGMTLAVGALLGLAAARLLARCGVDDARAQLLAAAVCLTLPAVANPMLEPKPDVIACLFVVLASLAAIDWLRTRQWPALAWLAAYGLLATQSKLTAIPFLGLLAVATLAHAWLRRAAPVASLPQPAPSPRAALVALALAVAVAVFVTARTQLLAGMPTIGPDPLFRLWQALGFTLREPVGTLQWNWPQEWAGVPALIVDWLFRPERLEHIIITWTGNVWLWLPLAAFALGGRHVPLPREARTPAVALILAGAIVATAWRYNARGGDGNYFIAAIVPAVVVGVAILWPRVARHAALRAGATAALLAFALFQAAYAFCSASWITGTREFDLHFDRGPRDTRKLDRAAFETHGMARIAQYLRALPGAPRVVGCADFGASARLPARFEDLVTMSYTRRHYTDDAGELVAYMRRFDVPYLMLRRPTPESRRMKDTPEGKVQGEPNGLCTPGAWTPPDAALVVEDAGYVLYRLSGVP
ncbi:hypothetical protein [Tahibacter soli]|uniref:Dolichyl-phosphate-mannose-protein mannosyltransferase n=1 Tax=Tahibacter soli TaxID=2983605 RepID=A0A9X3YGY1_9GAMM|nr:hypothetical protein [Tahibacter soli]MDC8012037.1 hypothetical protein [Tahibacter soli]